MGIGGGVALACLQFSLALGAQVYVTSSSDEKIAKAVSLGAKGGVNYTHGENFWPIKQDYSLNSITLREIKN